MGAGTSAAANRRPVGIRNIASYVAGCARVDVDGSKALVSIWEMDGAVIVYDAETFKEIKRLPMVKPSGKYNVWNKITVEDGTSH